MNHKQLCIQLILTSWIASSWNIIFICLHSHESIMTSCREPRCGQVHDFIAWVIFAPMLFLNWPHLCCCSRPTLLQVKSWVNLGPWEKLEASSAHQSVLLWITLDLFLLGIVEMQEFRSSDQMALLLEYLEAEDQAQESLPGSLA